MNVLLESRMRNDSLNHEVEDSRQGCPICRNTGEIESWRNIECPFCNGTCEYTNAAASFMRIHPCQCIQGNSKDCPLCSLKCHHQTGNKPKMITAEPPRWWAISLRIIWIINNGTTNQRFRLIAAKSKLPQSAWQICLLYVEPDCLLCDTPMQDN